MNGLCFENREEAGRRLGSRLGALALPEPRCVLALPRGGVPVGLAVASALRAPLDILLVRKLCVPWKPGLAVAAVVEGAPPETVVDHAVAHDSGVTLPYIKMQASLEAEAIARLRQVYCGGRPLPSLAGKTVIVVDDGMSTGMSLRAASKALRGRGLAHLVLAVPVASPQALALLEPAFDVLVCLHQPSHVHSIGASYRDFPPLDDRAVITALAAADAAGHG